MDLEDPAERQQFFSNLDESIDAMAYPVCDPELIYRLVDVMFLRDSAATLGHTEFSAQIQARIDNFLAPLQSIRASPSSMDDLSDEAITILDTSTAFNEGLTSFTEHDGTVIHGTDIANHFIAASTAEDAKTALKRFDSWYIDTLESMLSEDELIESGRRTYSREDFIRVARYNGLRRLFQQREEGEQFETREIQL